MARTDKEKKFEELYKERMRVLNEVVQDRSEFSIPFGEKLMGLLGSVIGKVAGFVASILSGGSNPEKVWNFFAEKGFSPDAIAGIMGNLEVESGFDPKIKQPDGPGRGLLQWSEGERWAELQKFASGQGMDEWELDTQLTFLYEHEMKPGTYFPNSLQNMFGMSMDGFKAVGDYKKATEMFQEVWERAGVPHYERRYNAAKGFLDKFGATGGGLGTGKAKQIKDISKDWLKKPNQYSRGAGRTAKDIRAGKFDASSFIHRVFFEANIHLGSVKDINQKELLRYGQKIGFDELRTGDIVFFDTHTTYAHAAIYIQSGRCIGMHPEGGIKMIDINKHPWKNKLSAQHRRIMT